MKKCDRIQLGRAFVLKFLSETLQDKNLVSVKIKKSFVHLKGFLQPLKNWRNRQYTQKTSADISSYRNAY